MGGNNEGKEWRKADVAEVWNAPKSEYGELADKLGRSLKSLEVLHRTKAELGKISEFVRPLASKPDRYMLEFFIGGKKPEL